MFLCTGALTLPVLFACFQHATQGEPEVVDPFRLAVGRDVDILFVIDNSSSMGEEQEKISRSFNDFIAVLEAEDVGANYRIGFTTTDNGNPLCSGTTPESGRLRALSCIDRLDEFIFTGQQTVDAQATCTEFCDRSLTVADLGGHPWLEKIDGVSNLPEPWNHDVAAAFQCLGPQGINGCGFESHLESMYRFFERSGSADEPESGFVREGAALALIFVTDAADCSHNPAYETIFLADGDRTFWSDPTASQATSAVCWNAGVSCTGGPGVYEQCRAANKDVVGNEGTSGDNAVLRTVSRYTDLMQRLAEDKRARNFDQDIVVAVIGGVPPGYAVDPTIEIPYADATDADDQNAFGIGFGCTSSGAEAIPPVRLREFAEAFEVDGARNLYSVCEEDYGPTLRAIAEKIRDQIKPVCMPACVRDTDPATPGVLDPLCTLEDWYGEPIRECLYLCNGAQRPECTRANADGWEMPAGATLCFHMLTDRTGTGGTLDDMSPECKADKYNLEFAIEGAIPAGARVTDVFRFGGRGRRLPRPRGLVGGGSVRPIGVTGAFLEDVGPSRVRRPSTGPLRDPARPR